MSPDMLPSNHLPAATTAPLVLGNARLVLPEGVVRGWLAVADGRILAQGEGNAPEGCIDLAGDFLLPGLIELHTDHLESHVQPRPKVRWDLLGAVLAYDAQIAASGITTVFDSLRAGLDEGGGGLGNEVHDIAAVLDKARRRQLLRADHLTHIRCEVPASGVTEALAQLAGEVPVGLISLMDHTPGQRQFRNMDRYYQYAARYGGLRHELEAKAAEKLRVAVERIALHRPALVAFAHEHGIPLASHDDTTLADVDQSVAEGVALAEFPTTPEAAAACRENGIGVMMGAPNMIRGGSHSGNVSAQALAEAGLLDMLSSDYVPASLLMAAFRLPKLVPSIGLHQAVAMVTSAPARATGLHDRGAIAPGLRADLVRVRLSGDVPVVRQVWRTGERVS
jgi:alpha-D-ribose 1-methylphosphonate 5-triphosphate diphosphatase